MRFSLPLSVRRLILIVLCAISIITLNHAASQAAALSATGAGKAPAACRQMLIYPSDYYGPVQRVTLAQSAANIKHMYWYKKPGGIQRLLITYNNNQRQEVRLMWNPDSIKGFSFWCHPGGMCVKVPGLEGQDYILNFMASFNNQPTHLACSTYSKGGFPGKVLFNNFNGNGADVKPTKKTLFRLNGRCKITEIQTFHHNRYRGKIPGKIYIRGINGTKGSWAFNARPGLSLWQNYFLPNCNWIVNPANLVLGPGDYQIDVSDPASWSQNTFSGHRGYAIVWGQCQKAAASTPAPAPSSTPSAASPWTAWRGHNYRVITTKMTWLQAEAYAQSLGGHLATISDQAENEFVTDLAQSKGVGKTFWIGFTDQGSEGKWRWASGQKVTYTNWYKSEPNNSQGKEHYCEVGWHSKYTWNDAPLDAKQGFVVEVGSAQAADYWGEKKILAAKVYDWPREDKDYGRVSKNLIFQVGMGDQRWGYGYAGILMAGFKGLNVAILSAPKAYERHDKNSFAGFVVDYGVEGGFAKRVYLGIGMIDSKRWGGFDQQNPSPKQRQFVNLGRHGTYKLDLAKWAPPGWNGKTWFWVGVANIGAGKYLKAQITSLR